MLSTVSVAKFGGPKSGKFRKMLAAFVEGKCLDLTKACSVAGYGFPSKAAAQVRKRWGQVIGAIELEYRSGLQMQAEEATEILAAIARNARHKDQFNAVKTLLLMHGKLDTTLNVKLSRSELNKALDDVLAQLADLRAIDSAGSRGSAAS